MSGRRKTSGLILAVVAITVLFSCLMPVKVVVVIEGMVLIGLGWLFFRKG